MEMLHDIGFSYRSNAMFITDMPGYGADGKTVSATDPKLDLSGWPWSPWDTENNNLFPKTLAKMIEDCGILNAACNAKSTIAVGKGIQPYLLTDIANDGEEKLVHLMDNEIITWLQENDMTEKALDFAYDEIAYGWRTGTFILNTERTRINKIIRKDIFTARLEKMDAKSKTPDVINNLYLSNNWDNVGFIATKSKEKAISRWVVTVPALREGYELEDLQSRKDGFEFAFIDRKKRNGRQYYPIPMWWSAVEWVKQAIEIPKQKNAIFKNSMLLRYVVRIHKQYWLDTFTDWATKPELRTQRINETYDSIDAWLGGTANQGKSLFSGSFTQPGVNEPVPYIVVEAVADAFKDGKLLPDSSAANVEVLMAALLNPAFIGAGSVGSATHGSQSGGSNIRESYMTQIMMMEAERRHTEKLMSIVAGYNGWTTKYNRSAVYTDNGELATPGRRLVWRFQSGLLTTLDTGKSSKPINT